MKKNLTKLALSGAALAAVAATLGTSTYAWYTTNPTVSANNIVGASSDQGASSIYIAKDVAAGQQKKWSSEVTFADDDFATAKLVPVQPVAAGGFNLLDGTTPAAATDVLEFSLWFKSSKVAADATYTTATVTAQTFVKDGSLFTRTGAGTDESPYVYTAVTTGNYAEGTQYYKMTNGVDLYLKSIKIANTTTALKPADNMIYGDTEYDKMVYGVDNTLPQYNVDFVNALGVRIVDTTSTATIKQTFELDSFQVQDGATAYATAQQTYANGFVAAAKAHAYYNKVMPENKALASSAITTGQGLTGTYTKAAITTLNPLGTNETARKLTFYVYLNGWNDYCYDACQGQTFALNLQFTKVADDAIATISNGD